MAVASPGVNVSGAETFPAVKSKFCSVKKSNRKSTNPVMSEYREAVEGYYRSVLGADGDLTRFPGHG